MKTQGVRLRELITNFILYSEAEVLAAFAALPNAQVNPQWVFIPGTRPDRVLLVAHADTAHPLGDVDLVWMGDVLMRADHSFLEDSRAKRVVHGQYPGGAVTGWSQGCLGADDRVGCAMMYDCWTAGHSLLITTGEESGLIGARAATTALKDSLAAHSFAIQVDRRGDRQCVFYDVASAEFEQKMVSMCTAFDYEKISWAKCQGSSTDIKHICGEVGISGVNLSAGYVNEHSKSETFYFAAWLHTRMVLKRILAQDAIVKFPIPVRVHQQPNHSGWYQHGSSAAVTSAMSCDKIHATLLEVAKKITSKNGKKKMYKNVMRLRAKKAIFMYQANEILKAMGYDALSWDEYEKIGTQGPKLLTDGDNKPITKMDGPTPPPFMSKSVLGYCTVCGWHQSVHSKGQCPNTAELNRDHAAGPVTSLKPPIEGTMELPLTGSGNLINVDGQQNSIPCTFCFHHCHKCGHGWNHVKPLRMRMCLMPHDRFCGTHDADTDGIVKRYEQLLKKEAAEKALILSAPAEQ